MRCTHGHRPREKRPSSRSAASSSRTGARSRGASDGLQSDSGIEVIEPETDGPGALDLLDVDAVVRAATSARADALHPGFGFLAENAAFAEAVEAAGIAWVGPPPEAIRAMGDKAAARRLAKELGVPIVPGYDGADQSDAALRRAAKRIGYPLLVKPAAGGGGKGMRTVRDPKTLERCPRRARAGKPSRRSTTTG